MLINTAQICCILTNHIKKLPIHSWYEIPKPQFSLRACLYCQRRVHDEKREPSLPRKTNYYFQWCKILSADKTTDNRCARQLHGQWQQFGSPTRLLCIDSYMSALCILSHRSGITETRTTVKRCSDLLIYRVNRFPPHSTRSYKTTMVALTINEFPPVPMCTTPVCNTWPWVNTNHHIYFVWSALLSNSYAELRSGNI